MTHSSIPPAPPFLTLEEEATFWDTHDFTEHSEGFEEVEAHFAPNLSQGITVRLTVQDLRELRQVATKKGIGVSSLARMWIKQTLDAEKQQISK
jgi:predicted phosphatase